MFKISKTSRLVMSKLWSNDWSILKSRFFAKDPGHDKGGIIWFYIKSFSKSEKFRESFEGTNFKKSQILKLTARFSLIMIQANH